MNEADYIISLGDTLNDLNILNALYSDKLIAVRGNCDFDSDLPSEKTVEIEGIRFFITHGHNYRVKSGLSDLIKKAKEISAGIVLYGHTHSPLIQEKEEIKFVNPGNMSGRGAMSYCYIVAFNGKVMARNVNLI